MDYAILIALMQNRNAYSRMLSNMQRAVHIADRFKNRLKRNNIL